MTIKRWTCVDKQSGLGLVDDGYVLGMLGPKSVYEDPEGAWVKWEDVKDLVNRKLTTTVNVNVDTAKILAVLEESLKHRVDELIAEQQKILDAGELETAARVCDTVAEGSGNSLFRSGAKICAGNIRALAGSIAKKKPLTSWYGFDWNSADLTPEQFQQEYLIEPPVAIGADLDKIVSLHGAKRLRSNVPKDGYAWNESTGYFEEKDSVLRQRIADEIKGKVFSAEPDFGLPEQTKVFGPRVSLSDDLAHTKAVIEGRAPLMLRKDLVKLPQAPIVPPAPPVYTVFGEALDHIGEQWGLSRRIWTVDGHADVETDETYRRRILDRMELKMPPRAPLELATGEDLDSHGKEWGLPRFVEGVGDLPGRIVESDADYRARIWTHIHATPSGGKTQEG